MQACVACAGKLNLQNVTKPEPGQGQVLVEMICSGCCHTDLHVIKEDFPGVQLDSVTIGHEGIGRVVKHGPGCNGDTPPIGSRVGIPWLYTACGACCDCMEGWETLCGKQKQTGCSVDGSLAQFCVADAKYCIPIPQGLTSSQAAPLMCAGVTTYKGLKDSGVRPGQYMVITGAGGGLGHLGVQYAKAMGMKVIGVDGGEAKMEFLKSLGCDYPLDFMVCKDIPGKIMEITGGRGADGVLLLAAVSKLFTQAVDYVKPRGSMMCIALPKGNFEVPHLALTTKAINCKGSIVGTRLDMQEALQFAADGKVKCTVEVREGLSQAEKTFEDMEKGAITGRVVLAIGDPAELEKTA